MTATFNQSAFQSQFPGSSLGKGNTAIEFKSQDAKYRVYIPGAGSSPSKLTPGQDGGLTITLVQDHEIGGGKDDHATTTLTFDAKGKLASVNHAVNLDDGGAYQIPGWVTTSLDGVVELAGAVGALESAGISEAVAQEVVLDITAICVGFNKISNVVYRHSDDGGRLNFPAVLSHNVNRVCAAVSG
jgi:hypothetical protein